MFVPVPGAGAWGAAEMMLVGGILLLGVGVASTIVRERGSRRATPVPSSL